MRLVAIGGSAGAIQALRALVAPLTPELDMAFLIVIHSSPRHKTKLPQLLARLSGLPARVANDGDRIERGHIYIAQAGTHLVVHGGRLHLVVSPEQNPHRTSVDALFCSVAQAAGVDAVGVIVSGGLNDGSVGLSLIKARGGVTIAQESGDAVIPSMPRSAQQSSAVDHVLPAAEIGAMLVEIDALPGR